MVSTKIACFYCAHDSFDSKEATAHVLEKHAAEERGAHLAQIYSEIGQERERQDVLHPGTSDIPNGTGGGGRQTWMNIAQHSCDRAAREGRLTYTHVLDEEVSEALAEEDPVKLRVELIQVAAVCVKWVQALDRE